MNALNSKPVLIAVTAVSLLLASLLLAYIVVLGQGDGVRPPTPTENEEPSGQIVGATAEELEALQTPGMEVLYQFTDALNETDPPSATIVHCTNVGDSPVDIQVQLYAYNASSVYTATTAAVQPLHTVAFLSKPTAFYMADRNLNAGTIDQAYGRILTTNLNVVCSAQILDPENSPPRFLEDLPLYPGNMNRLYLGWFPWVNR